MSRKPKAIILMKVGPHSNMSLNEIIQTKQEEEKLHGVHYWGYSGVFCQPTPTQIFCNQIKKEFNELPTLILMETKSSYISDIGMINQYSEDNQNYQDFKAPVQLQGAQFSFVAKNLRVLDDFCLDDYRVVGGKNDGKSLSEHLKFRVNKCFGRINGHTDSKSIERKKIRVLAADMVEPYAVWLKD